MLWKSVLFTELLVQRLSKGVAPVVGCAPCRVGHVAGRGAGRNGTDQLHPEHLLFGGFDIHWRTSGCLVDLRVAAFLVVSRLTRLQFRVVAVRGVLVRSAPCGFRRLPLLIESAGAVAPVVRVHLEYIRDELAAIAVLAAEKAMILGLGVQLRQLVSQ